MSWHLEERHYHIQEAADIPTVKSGEGKQEQSSVETANVHRKSPLGKCYAQKKVMPSHKCTCQDRLLLPIFLFSLHPYLSPVTEGPRQDLWNEGGSRVGR